MKMISVNGEQYGILGVMGKGGSSKVSMVMILNFRTDWSQQTE